jgi:hypothetical protein
MSPRLARLPLVPVEVPGPWWRRHRCWLTSPVPFTGTKPIIVNMRTGMIHDWGFRGNRRGRGWFGVRTRWAWRHPAWKGDPWVLFYVPSEAAVP